MIGERNMIPKVIHYCWFGGKPLPYSVKQCIKSWRKYCPDYEIKQWNESNYDVNSHPFMATAFKNGRWAFVSDYARLDLINRYGGFYMDTDVELKKSLDVFQDCDCFFAMHQKTPLIATGLGFGAAPGHPAVKAMLAEYDGLIYSDEEQKKFVCPDLNTRALAPNGLPESNDIFELCGAKVYPPRYCDPVRPGNDTENLICQDTISIHHYSATWMSKRYQFKRALIRLIGVERIHKIKELIR